MTFLMTQYEDVGKCREYFYSNSQCRSQVSCVFRLSVCKVPDSARQDSLSIICTPSEGVLPPHAEPLSTGCWVFSFFYYSNIYKFWVSLGYLFSTVALQCSLKSSYLNMQPHTCCFGSIHGEAGDCQVTLIILVCFRFDLTLRHCPYFQGLVTSKVSLLESQLKARNMYKRPSSLRRLEFPSLSIITWPLISQYHTLVFHLLFSAWFLGVTSCIYANNT